MIVKARPEMQDLLLCFDVTTFPQLIWPLLKLLKEVAAGNFYSQAMLLLYSFPLNVNFSITSGDLCDAPELLPIYSMIAIPLGHDDQAQIADFLSRFVRTKLEIHKLQNWFLWPILFALQTCEEIRGIMCQVIATVIVVDFQIDKLNKIFASFDLLDANIAIELRTVELLIVQELLHMLPAGSHGQLADFCFQVLAVKCTSGSHSNELLALLSGSPFTSEFKQMKLPSAIRTMTELRNIIRRGNKLNHRLVLSRSVSISVAVIQGAVEAFFTKISIPDQKSRLFCKCISYPCQTLESRQVTLLFLHSLHDSRVRPFLAGLKRRSIAFGQCLLASLHKHEQQLTRIHERKSGIVGPGLQELAIETATVVCATAAWRGISCPNLNPNWKSGLIKKWRSNLISNYDFLLRLSLFSGRSFRDHENYIIFPWVTFPPDEFRDLQFPIAAQTASRRKELLRLLQLNKANPDGAYTFGSAPSNGMSLGFFFVRLQPFTSLHLLTHDGKFDYEDRMFTSLTTFFNGIEANGECCEASPEFFPMPEVLLSLADDCLIKDVSLPSWTVTASDFV
jgi:hypothetical protein